MNTNSHNWQNPYFDEVAGGVTVGGDHLATSDQHIELLTRREALVRKYGWAIPNYEAIATIADHGPIVEPAAGNGYWAYLCDQLEVDIMPSDSAEPDNEWFPVAQYDAVEVAANESHWHRTLLTIWPEHAMSWTDEMLDAYGGETVIYVGEGRGGCTGTDRFHEILHTNFECVETVAIPSYMGIRDRLEVWTRRD